MTNYSNFDTLRLLKEVPLVERDYMVAIVNLVATGLLMGTVFYVLHRIVG